MMYKYDCKTIIMRRGGCLIYKIFGTLVLHDDSELKCNYYDGKGTGYSQFYIMLIDCVCCL